MDTVILVKCMECALRGDRMSSYICEKLMKENTVCNITVA